jgi:two-component system heavy metal sensor histidine kinase CusS
MLSKRAADAGAKGGRGSIALRLTAWYALLSVALVASAGSVLYWVLADCLRRDDDQWLAGQIAQIRAFVTMHATDTAALRAKVTHETIMLPGSYLRVLDASGNTLVDTADPVDQPPGHPVAEFDFGAGRPDAGMDWTSRRGAMYRLMYSRIDERGGLTVQVAIDRSGEEEVLKSYRLILWTVLSLSLVTAIVAGYLIARRNLAPLSGLAAMIDQLGAAHLDRRVADADWPRELRPLAANFDQLLARLDASFARVSRFSADIAHELRTPLHILQGEAELALSKARSNDDYRECIVSATEEYDRLARMVDALLFLARTESPEALPDKKALDLEQEITSVCAFYQALADEQETSLVITGSGSVLGDAGLLRRALGNLIVNALRHTPAGGSIAIAVRQGAGHGVEISVTDSGEGIAAHDLPYVFDRFYRADNARSGHGSGTGSGLGLAIVKSIMQLHGGSVELRSEPGRGTSATLAFPAPPGAGA